MTFGKALLLAILTLALVGCAVPTGMQKIAFIDKPSQEMVLVNIVRPSVFMGDAVAINLWDGKKYLGAIGVDAMLQYQTEPGYHMLMAETQGAWGLAEGVLLANNTYYLKINLSGVGFISLGVAKPSDERIPIWNKYFTPISLNASAAREAGDWGEQQIKKVYKKIDAGKHIATQIESQHAIPASD